MTLPAETAPDYCTFDGDIAHGVYPYRPLIADLGGVQLANDEIYPPNPEQNVTAPQMIQLRNQLVRIARMMPVASFYLTRSGSSVTCGGFKCTKDSLISSGLTLDVYDHYSVGETALRVRWSLHSLPVATVPPKVSIVRKQRCNYVASVASFVNATYAGFVVCVDSSGSNLTTFSCRVDIDGEGAFEP